MTLVSPATEALPGGVAAVLADAAFLGERLAGDWVAPAPGADGPAGGWRVARLGAPPPGRTAAQLAAAAGPVALRRVPDADWAHLLVAHLTGDTVPGGDWPVPYGWLLGPLAARAWAPLAGALDARLVTDTLAAHVRRSAWWLGPALHRGFAAYRDARTHRLDTALAARSAAPPAVQHAAYVAAAGPTGLAVWRRQPVVARLAAQLAVDEVALLRRVLAALAADGGAVAGLLGVDRLAPLALLRTGLGDRHEGGASVCRLRFADGREVIFRPRRHDGLAVLRAALAGLPGPVPPVPAAVDRGGHSWVAAVAAEPVADPRRYHAAAGALLGALHALGATDIHRDNIVRTAAGPVVVDAETVAHPVTAFETAATDALADRPLPAGALVDSALRVGLLPAWDFAADGALLDAGHLLPDLPGAGRIAVPELTHPGTDAETLRYAPAPVVARHDLPAPGYDPAPHADAVAAGYAAAVGRVAPPPAAPGRRVRLLLRYTTRYVDTLLRALGRADLRDGVDLDLALAALPPGGADITPALREAELADLRRLDVPYFEWEPAGGAVRHRGRRIGTLAPPPRPPVDPAAGVALVRGALRARDAAPGLATDPAAAPAGRADALAGALLADLVDRAVPVGAGSTWCGAAYRHGRFTRMPVGWSLYDGQAGIALALAAGSTVDPALRAAAGRAAGPLLDRVAADPAGLCAALGPGYLHGAAGVLWALRHLPPLLPGPAGARAAAAADLLADALAAAVRHRPAGTPVGDLADGVPGALLVLAGEPARRPAAASPVRAALAAGAAAVRAAAEAPGAPADGYGPDGTADRGGAHRRDGLAHGRAGTALGLWRAAAALGDAAAAPLAAAAHRLIAADRSAGWTWCTGGVGAALAAAAIGVGTLPGSALPAATDPDPGAGAARIGAAHISAARIGAARIGAGGDAGGAAPGADSPHHLCCGVVGHALAADPSAAAAVLDRLAADGAPRYLRPLPPGLHQPGLFQGAAGLALGVLLLTRPGLPDPLRATDPA
ncbi:hypothetical protein GCM10010123_39060 [Pilimelia anulata]|uniref:Lantibiotic biosynthesis protein dehydration domain-containing protein n=1 Tax=Pilimelia anulata TaxID=53371 RepID=A0A8J3BAP0_9ACTN|nr:DUF4135 domain-containing protein [Pilimelia anulata]GGK05392.1 hypothetical protein GCM10010123_39060 [Pilimelia anulata]